MSAKTGFFYGDKWLGEVVSDVLPAAQWLLSIFGAKGGIKKGKEIIKSRRSEVLPQQPEVSQPIETQSRIQGPQAMMEKPSSVDSTTTIIPNLVDQTSKSQTPQIGGTKGKQRKFLQTVKESEKTTPEFKEKVEGIEPQTHDVFTNEEAKIKAEKTIRTDPDKARETVLSDAPPTAEKSVLALRLIKKYEADKNYDNPFHFGGVQVYYLRLAFLRLIRFLMLPCIFFFM